mgnify:CR=1 FL=1
MAKWNKMIYTEEGRKLLANAAAGTCQVEFVRAAIGDGTYSEEEKTEQKLSLRTQLKNERNSYGFSSIKAEDNTAYLKVALQNTDVDTAYFVNELGVFAKEKGSSEEAVLVLIAVAEIPDYFPEKSNAITIIQSIAIEFEDVKQLSIADDMGAYALANTEYSISETLQSLVSGENMGTALGKLAKAVEELILTRKLYGNTTINIGRSANSTVGNGSTAEGSNTTASGNCSHAEGNTTAACGKNSHAEGYLNTASGDYSHVEGWTNMSLGESSHTEGSYNRADGYNSHSEGNETSALGDNSHVEGYRTTALGKNSHVEGASTNTLPSGISSKSTNDEVITKWGTTKFSLAKGQSSHTEGENNLALGKNAHAEGRITIAKGDYSHAENYKTTASGGSSHAEGYNNTASGNYSHVEGYYTTASHHASHAEGGSTIASGIHSHAEGFYTTAGGEVQHVEGQYNIPDTDNKYAHIIGNGTSTKRSNAHTVDWYGNAWYAGGMSIYGEDGLTLRDAIGGTSASDDIPAQFYTVGRSLIFTAPFNESIPDDGVSSATQGAGLELRSCVEGILPIAQGRNTTWYPHVNLGDSSRSFGTVYCLNTNSDKKIKKDIEILSESDLADKYVEILDLINFVKFRWKHNMNGGMETPPSSRYHYGIIAQEIEKLLKDIGIGTYDNGIIKADFFAKNTSNAFITGGYRGQFENEENGVTYDYSKNTYDFKKGNDYSVYNEILDKELSTLNRCNGYADRSSIGYLMIEDNSKLSEKYEDRPPVTIKGIILIDKEGNTKKLSIDFAKCISYYEWNDENLSNPKTSGTLNEDGSITVSFNKKYSTYMIKVDDFNFFDYERIVLDVDYVGEYKVYLIPNATEGHVNANVYDRDRVDDIMLTYHVEYQELQILCLHALQQKSKKQASEIEELRKEIEELKGLIKNA